MITIIIIIIIIILRPPIQLWPHVVAGVRDSRKDSHKMPLHENGGIAGNSENWFILSDGLGLSKLGFSRNINWNLVRAFKKEVSRIHFKIQSGVKKPSQKKFCWWISYQRGWFPAEWASPQSDVSGFINHEISPMNTIVISCYIYHKATDQAT